jgi:hypothetical protein
MYLFVTLAVNHGHFLLLMLKLEFDADFINVFGFFFCQNRFFSFNGSE